MKIISYQGPPLSEKCADYPPKGPYILFKSAMTVFNSSKYLLPIIGRGLKFKRLLIKLRICLGTAHLVIRWVFARMAPSIEPYF